MTKYPSQLIDPLMDRERKSDVAYQQRGQCHHHDFSMNALPEFLDVDEDENRQR
jgi:hypothetical protein